MRHRRRAALRAFVFALLLGCGGGAASSSGPASSSHPASEPASDPDDDALAVDSMACEVDADCMVGTPRDCCTSFCPSDVEPWSHSAWAAYQDECAVEECPTTETLACLDQPDWVRPVAVCQAGQCALARPDGDTR